MAKSKTCIAMLLAGGQGSRLYPLTKRVAKPAISFGGKYRIIDFPLSNCVNSGIDTVGVLTQYMPLELNDYIGNGEPWDLDRNYGGAHILPPYQKTSGSDWFKGTANAIYQNLHFIEKYKAKYVLILSGDHIYKMNYDEMLQAHIDKGADCSIAVMNVPIEEASRFGIMTSDETGRVTDFTEKPAHPTSTKASMGIYIFSYDVMKKYLEADEQNPDSENDFGKNVIPAMLEDGCGIYTYDFEGYWKDVGTLSSLWESNMDMLEKDNELALSDSTWKIYFRHANKSAQYIGSYAKVKHSIIADGCEVEGVVENSVLFSGVRVEKGAHIKDSVIFPNCTIGKDSDVEYTIMDGDVSVADNARIGGSREEYPDRITVIAEKLAIGSGAVVEPGAVVEKDLEDNEEVRS